MHVTIGFDPPLVLLCLIWAQTVGVDFAQPFLSCFVPDMNCANGLPQPWDVNTEFSCAPTYTITQRDVDAGIVSNVVR